jgi:putative hydrolase of the HAD superfamily
MFGLSQPLSGDPLPLARALAGSGKYLMATINNESRELNLYRIQKFGLRQIFRVFFSSCFVGLRKPERDIYRIAIETTQFPAEQCCFLDDRAINLEGAAQLGMHTVQVQSLEQMKVELAKLGVSAERD